MELFFLYSTTDVLGSGQFGVVYRGEWSKPGEEKGVPVAVKTLKAGKDREQKVKFLQEAAIIGQFSHPNVVKLHGIVIGEEVLMGSMHGRVSMGTLCCMYYYVTTMGILASYQYTVTSGDFDSCSYL